MASLGRAYRLCLAAARASSVEVTRMLAGIVVAGRAMVCRAPARARKSSVELGKAGNIAGAGIADLAGFWTRHYPALCKQLMRRYPRHAWPEDPLRATPPSR